MLSWVAAGAIASVFALAGYVLGRWDGGAEQRALNEDSEDYQ